MKKIFIILEVVIILAVVVIGGIVQYKKYQNDLGSSVRLFTYKNYKTAVRLKNSNIDVIVLINKKNEISNLVFLTNNSKVLYNKNIEGNKLEVGVERIIKTLQDMSYIDDDLVIINYKDENVFKRIVSIIDKSLQDKNIVIKIEKKQKSIQSLASEFNLSVDKEDKILSEIYYNKNLINDFIQEEDKKEISNDNKNININYQEYTDVVYKKLLSYKDQNGIVNQDISSKIDISKIPVDIDKNIYPEQDSWYYIKNGNIYAYIKVKIEGKTKDFCYNGSIDNVEEGVCNDG